MEASLLIFIGKKNGLLGQDLAQHIALEGKGHMRGEPIRCLALSSHSVQIAWSCGQLPPESNTQGSLSVSTCRLL